MPRVCAVVVTFNRRALLTECLGALLGQTSPLTRILVVDNVSTDGTRELLSHDYPATRFPQIEVLALEQNVGGAGGFHAGMRHALAAGHDWLWLLDDDTIPRPDALAELFAARERLGADGSPPDLLASRVLWTDGSMHPMNVPRLKRNDHLESQCRAALCGTLSLRSTSFVSMLVHRRLVEQYGLPLADYFVWIDDVEFTARILRQEFGVLAPASVAVHKTGLKQADPGPRFYYGLRNSLWMLRHSDAWSGQEKMRLLATNLKDAFDYLQRDPTLARFGVVARALKDGLLGTPAR